MAAASTRAGGVAQLVKLLDKAGIGGRGRRSSLTRWMRIHHDSFATMLADKQPAWHEVAVALAAMGLRDGKGEPPTAERVRKTWWNTQRTHAAAIVRRASPPTPPWAGDEIASRVHVMRSLEAAHLETTRLEIAPGVRPTAQASAPVDPPPGHVRGVAMATSGPDGESDHMRRLRESMQAGKVPVPKPL